MAMKLQKNMHDGAAAPYSSHITRHAQENGLGVEGYCISFSVARSNSHEFIHVEINERARSPVPSQMYRRCRDKILGSCVSVRCGHFNVCMKHYLPCTDVTSAFKWTKAS